MPFDKSTVDQQAQLIADAMGSSEGRMFLAQRLMDPIKQERDYVSMGRQGFVLDPLAQGEVPYYDSDIKTMAVVLPERGEVPTFRAQSNRVQVPIFPLASYPMVSIEDTKVRRFNILERVQTKARADLAEEEDRLIFGDLATVDVSKSTYAGQNKEARGSYTIMNPDGTSNSASGISVYRYATPESGDSWATSGVFSAGEGEDIFDHQTNSVTVSTVGLTREFLGGMYGEVLRHDVIPEAFLLNPVDYIDFWSWGRDEFDPETQREVLQTGRMGSIWNTEIHTSKIVPPGTVYCRAKDEFFGVMPILIDLEVLDAPDPKGLAYGFVFYEFIGMAILNCWGISRGSVTRTGI